MNSWINTGLKILGFQAPENKSKNRHQYFGVYLCWGMD